MGEIYIIRHGEANVPFDMPHGESYSLNPQGEQDILKTGRALKKLVAPRAVRGIDCAPTIRSRHTANLLAGGLGTSALITPDERLQYAGVSAARLLFELNQWADTKHDGVYLAALPRRAILAALAPVFGLSAADIDGEENADDASGIVIPRASITHVAVTQRGLQVGYLGRDSEHI